MELRAPDAARLLRTSEAPQGLGVLCLEARMLSYQDVQPLKGAYCSNVRVCPSPRIQHSISYGVLSALTHELAEQSLKVYFLPRATLSAASSAQSCNRALNESFSAWASATGTCSPRPALKTPAATSHCGTRSPHVPVSGAQHTGAYDLTQRVQAPATQVGIHNPAPWQALPSSRTRPGWSTRPGCDSVTDTATADLDGRVAVVHTHNHNQNAQKSDNSHGSISGSTHRGRL